jgi:hypothetical protein
MTEKDTECQTIFIDPMILGKGCHSQVNRESLSLAVVAYKASPLFREEQRHDQHHNRRHRISIRDKSTLPHHSIHRVLVQTHLMDNRIG